MNKFYVIVMKDDSQAITGYATQNAATSAFFSEMAYAYNAGIDTTCIVCDRFGIQYKKEVFTSDANLQVGTQHTQR